MFVRALFAFLLLPGFVAGIIPYLIYHLAHSAHSHGWLAALFLSVGIICMAWCVRDFYVIGKGTLAPWSAPQELVIVGLYKVVRNPMYCSVIIVLLGWCLLSFSGFMLLYTAVIASAFHLRVVLYEEPHLAKLFNGEWQNYSRSVNRWLPTTHATNE